MLPWFPAARSEARPLATRTKTNAPTSQKGRMASVKKREQPAQAALTRNEVHDHFKRVLVGTKWEKMRGLHTLRHSFHFGLCQQGSGSASGAGMGRAHERGDVETIPAPLSLDAAEEAIKGVFA